MPIPVPGLRTNEIPPVSDASVILGKFFGSLVFYLALLATTLLYWVLMVQHADPLVSVMLGGYLGMILLGALFIAIGIFASCCTRHQLLAAIIAISVLGNALTRSSGLDSLEQAEGEGDDWRV